MSVDAFELNVGGESMRNYLVRGSLRIRETLENRASVMNFTVQAGYHMDQDGIPPPVAGMVVGASDTFVVDGGDLGRALFYGFVTRVEPRREIGVGSIISLDVECSDATYILINHEATETYTAQTLGYIVTDLVNNSLPGYSIDLSDVDDGPTIDTVQFNHLNLRKCFERLAALTGYEWWMDFYGALHFKPKGYASAPEEFTDESANYESVTIESDASQVRNSITIEGGVTLSSAYFEDVFVANGQTRSWPLTYKPKEMVSIEVDDGGGYDVQTYGVDPAENALEAAASPGTYQFMYNESEKFVRQGQPETTQPNGYKIRVRYNYETPIVTEVQGEDSIAYMAAIEGIGDGVHAYHIQDDSILSLQEAILRGQREIDEYGFPIYDIRIKTRRALLDDGSFFAPGQIATVTFPSWKIDTPLQLLVQEVLTTFKDDGTDMFYEYQIRLGGRRITAAWLLDRILTKQEPIDATVEQRKVKSVKETVGASETIVRDNGRSVSETTGASETIVATITTVPYNWQASVSKPATWDLFVWG